MKSFIATLFFILLFVVGYITDTGSIFSHIATGFVMSFIGYAVVYAFCGMIEGDDEILFPWVAGILNVILIFDVYSFLFLK